MSRNTEDLAGEGHNSYNITADELTQFIEQWEQLDSERADVVELQKEVMAEAKGRGFDTKTIRAVIKLRKKSKDERVEEQMMLDTYLSALGMEV